MNLRDLEYLVAVADHRHFGEAAAACFVSQPTLSTQIKKLETELGVTLIERSPRRVTLTPVGERIVEKAREVLGGSSEIESLARAARDPESGSLHLGLFPTLAPYLLPHVVGPLHERFPHLELLLVEEKSEVLLEQLREGRLDAALLARPIRDDGLVEVPLFTERFLLAVPQSDDLAQKDEIEVDELSGRDILLLDEGHCLREQVLSVCQLAGAHERRGFRATSLETLRQMVAAGVGVTFLPQLAVTPPVPTFDAVRTLRLSQPSPTREIAIYWRSTSPLEAMLRELSSLLGSAANEVLKPTNR